MSWQTERARAILELRRRRGLAARITLRDFIRRANPHYQFYPYADRLIDLLERVADGELSRLMIFLPPRHGKSLLVSQLFPAYYLLRHPARWVGLNSYAADLAHTFSRNARDNYGRAGGVMGGKAGEAHWETHAGGGLWAAGVGGPITGRGFFLGLVDDPLKNSEEAESATIREKHKDWWRSTFYTRREPGAAVIVIQTRWHEADLSGWLLSEEYGEQPERWHIVNFPALAGSERPDFPPTCTLEPDERAEGEALCPERYSAEQLVKTRAVLGPYFWSALYDQNPTPRSGDFFQRAWFEIVGAVPSQARRLRYWDKAGTPDGGDFSAGVLMAEADGVYYVCDVVRGQWSPHERNAIMRQVAEMDGPGVPVWVEQEGGSGGKESAQISVKGLAGFPVRAETVSGEKWVRAQPLADQAQAGNVKLLRADWNKAFLDELTSFPRGRHDDMVDAASGAFNKLARGAVITPGLLPSQLATYTGLNWSQRG